MASYSDLQKKQLESMERFRKEVASTWNKERAMDWLVRLGTHNPDGTLTELYGGVSLEPKRENK